jgi:hypothetical protein
MGLSNLQVNMSLAALISKSLGDGTVVSSNYKRAFAEIPTDANLLFVNGYTIATSSSQSLDLAGGVMDAFGTTMTFAKVYGILVVNLATVAGRKITVGGDTNHVPIFGAGADFMNVGPKGALQLMDVLDGITVTGGTGDVLKISNAAGGQDISVAVAVLGKS